MKPMNFSVSTQNEDVLKILDKVENKSDYICKAIREKFQREQSEIAANFTEEQRESLRKEIKGVIIDMFGENLCLFGNVNGVVVPTPQIAPTYIESKPQIRDTEQEESKENIEDSEENLDKLADIFKSL